MTDVGINAFVERSLSARRAWIEIALSSPDIEVTASLSARRAWIEIVEDAARPGYQPESLSARRAWIEIRIGELDFVEHHVALRKESVD